MDGSSIKGCHVDMSTEPTADQPADPSVQLATFAHRAISGMALVSFLLVLAVMIFDFQLPGKSGWAEVLMLFSATAATVTGLSRHLPMQNVLLGAAIIAFIGTLAHGIGAATAIPFGPFSYSAAIGPRFGNWVAWPMPFLWVVIVLNSRGVAR